MTRNAFDKWIASDESLRPFGLEPTEAFRLAAWKGWQAGAAAEREACAKVCDMLDAHPATKWPDDCAAAIRKRGEE